MKLEDLWIGDNIMQLSSGKSGKFNGIDKTGNAIIKLKDGSQISSPPSDLTSFEEPVIIPEWEWQDDPGIEQADKTTPPVGSLDRIDLHYDQLSLSAVHDQGTILDFQLKQGEEFIQKAITSRKPYVRIIHGKGQGILKTAVDNLLKKYQSSISLQSPHPDGTSVDVWFK